MAKAPGNLAASVKERLLQLAAAVADDQPALATALITHIHDFDYASILSVVDRIQKG